MGESIAPILFGGVLVLTIVVIWLCMTLLRLNKKLRTFMSGKDAASLEDTVATLVSRSAHIEETLHSHKDALEFLHGRI